MITIADAQVWLFDRIIYISDDINKDSVGSINTKLLSLINIDDKEDEKQKEYKREPIKIYVNSFGGSTYDMWSTIDIILNSKTPIYTYCTGYAMSSGFKIFLAGHKRYSTKHSTFLYHQLTNGIRGKYLDLVQSLEEDTRLQKDIEKYVIERTKIPQSKLDEIKEKKIDWYIPAEEALSLGIIDEIL